MRQDPRMRKPFIRLGRPNEKGFNTDTTKVADKVGARCLDPEIYKDSVNTRRINKEYWRHKMALAKYVAFPRLVVSRTERLVALTTKHNHN